MSIQKNNRDNTIYTKFENPQEVWFWFCASQYARENMMRSEGRGSRDVVRPCVPDDILQIVLQLNFAGILQKRHVNVMTKYGRLFYVPDYRIKEEAVDALLWDDAMDKLMTIFTKREIMICKQKIGI